MQQQQQTGRPPKLASGISSRGAGPILGRKDTKKNMCNLSDKRKAFNPCTCARTHTYARIHTYGHAHTHTRMHTHAHTRTHAHMRTHTHIRVRTCTCIRVHVQLSIGRIRINYQIVCPLHKFALGFINWSKLALVMRSYGRGMEGSSLSSFSVRVHKGNTAQGNLATKKECA